jgi:hypothetical protein
LAIPSLGFWDEIKAGVVTVERIDGIYVKQTSHGKRSLNVTDNIGE